MTSEERALTTTTTTSQDITTQRRPIVAGNWKMNTSVPEAGVLAREIAASVTCTAVLDIVLCPPFISLTTVYEAVASSDLVVGAQNVSAHDKGAYTGDISCTMLRDFCRYVIVGHSERRHYHLETDADVNAKASAVLAAGMTPIICVGEQREQRDRGETQTFISAQVRGALDGLHLDGGTSVVLAYEPLWAIGSGAAATGDIAQNVAATIRATVGEMFGPAIAGAVRIQYGGSVTDENASEFATQADIDGALVGGGSLKAWEFCAIAAAFAGKI